MSLIVGIPSTISELFLFVVVVRSQGCVIPGLEEAQEARLFPPRCGWGSTARGSGRKSRGQQPGETGRRPPLYQSTEAAYWGLGMTLMDYTMICFCTEVFRGTVEHAKTAFLPTQNMMLLRAHMPNLFSNVFGKKK